MIQQTNARLSNATALAPLRQGQSDGPEQWGQWSGRKHYSLEVVQHPLRARMCGFGDKDRRPLAPAAVAKMIVRREDNTLVDIDDVDCSFFLVTVDLWSADGKQEMNLVLHPSSADRYVPPSATKTRRRVTSTSVPPRLPENQTPTGRSTPTPSQYRPGDQPSAIQTPMVTPQVPAYTNQGYFPQQPPIAEPLNYPAGGTYGNPSTDAPTWGYSPSVDRSTSFPPPALPSIHSFGRNSGPAQEISVNASETWNTEGTQEILPYRAWNTNEAYSVDGYSHPQVDPTLRNNDGRENPGWNQQDNYNSSLSNSQVDHTVYASAPYPQTPVQPAQYQPVPYPQHVQDTSTLMTSAPVVPLPRHSYTRTLVGPLSANACRLLDEHRKPGIFFLFQDLSVRTEGTFRLRLRLMNVGAPPAPEAGATRVHTDMSPVLAQTFTEQFVVYSAKRFPGVPDTTALSIAFGNQGQKLPLRNRHGSKRRRRGDSESDDDDSDGA